MLDVTFLGWAATLAVIVGLLALDWLVHGSPTARGRAERGGSMVAVLRARFGLCSASSFALLNGWDLGAQFFAGYVVEKSLVGRQPVRVRDHHRRVRGAVGAAAKGS